MDRPEREPGWWAARLLPAYLGDRGLAAMGAVCAGWRRAAAPARRARRRRAAAAAVEAALRGRRRASRSSLSAALPACAVSGCGMPQACVVDLTATHEDVLEVCAGRYCWRHRPREWGGGAPGRGGALPRRDNSTHRHS